ncbi:MAG: hypothetical protein GY820_30395 [Gammaproteobacteria bacterium]|nr:hypothetical protein [Gammaproteobacteria bacterium]
MLIVTEIGNLPNYRPKTFGNSVIGNYRNLKFSVIFGFGNYRNRQNYR